LEVLLVDKNKSGIREALRKRAEEEPDRDPIVVVLKIGDAISSRGLTQKQVAEMTGIRPAAISALSRGFIDRLTLDHLAKIAEALNIGDIRELIDLELESEAWNMATTMTTPPITDNGRKIAADYNAEN